MPVGSWRAGFRVTASRWTTVGANKQRLRVLRLCHPLEPGVEILGVEAALQHRPRHHRQRRALPKALQYGVQIHSLLGSSVVAGPIVLAAVAHQQRTFFQSHTRAIAAGHGCCILKVKLPRACHWHAPPRCPFPRPQRFGPAGAPGPLRRARLYRHAARRRCRPNRRPYSEVRKDNFQCQYQPRDDQSLAIAGFGIQMPLQYLSRHFTTPLTPRSLLESRPKGVLSQCCQANRTKVGGCVAEPEFRPDRVVLAVCTEQKLQRRECFLFFDNECLGSGSTQ